MDVTLLDALLGFALAYSATYVLYCWLHADARAQDRRPATVKTSAADRQQAHRSSSLV